MKIEDCEVGMKVRLNTNMPDGTEIFGSPIKKGEIFTIKKIIKSGCILLEEIEYGWRPKDFEPANKFEVGDEVLFENVLGNKYKVKIFGISKNKGKLNYAIEGQYLYDEEYFNCIVSEKSLSPLKKKDELEPGNKFKIKTAEGKTNRINEVLGVFKDDKYNQIKYVAKRVQGDWKGYVDIYNSEMIDEIIYE
jgi:hypothetical protein